MTPIDELLPQGRVVPAGKSAARASVIAPLPVAVSNTLYFVLENYGGGPYFEVPGPQWFGAIPAVGDTALVVFDDQGDAWVFCEPAAASIVARSDPPPASPVEGQDWYYDLFPDLGIYATWHFKWRSAGGTYKWEFVGGPALMASSNDLAIISAALTTYSDFDTAGDPLTISVPLVGMYRIKHDGALSSGDSQLCYLTHDGCGTTANDGSASKMTSSSAVTGMGMYSVDVALSATGTLSQKGRKSLTNNSAGWERRVMIVEPLRVT